VLLGKRSSPRVLFRSPPIRYGRPESIGTLTIGPAYRRAARRGDGGSLCYGSLASARRVDPWPSAAMASRNEADWGRVSAYGVFELAATLDHVARCPRAQMPRLLGVIAGSDPNDPTAMPDPVPDYLTGRGIRACGVCASASMLPGTATPWMRRHRPCCRRNRRFRTLAPRL